MYRILIYGISWETLREERWETVWEERRGSTVREELDVPKEWLRESR